MCEQGLHTIQHKSYSLATANTTHLCD